MNFNLKPRLQEQANVLIAALVIGVVVGISLIAYLSWSTTQNRLIMRSQVWNSALPLAEAGLEEALTQMNTGPTNLATRGWTLVNNEYTRQRNVGEGFFKVSISNDPFPVIVSEGFAPSPLNDGQFISRKVMVTTTNRSLFYSGITVRRGVDLNGNNVYVDSYDSEDPNHSTLGKYDPAKRKDNGSISASDGIQDTVNIGNANVYGKVATGPLGTVSTGPNGAVGSTAWHTAGNSGVEPGWVSHDYNLPIRRVKEPVGAALTPGPIALGPKPEDQYDYSLTDGLWEINGDLAGKVHVSGNAQLIITGDINMNSVNDQIHIASGGSLKMWVMGTRAFMAADSIKNTDAIPDDFHLYGGENLADIDFGGKVDYAGVIHAPMADLKFGGGGANTKINVSGAITARSVIMTGRIDMHFDESLQQKYTSGNVVTSWTEL